MVHGVEHDEEHAQRTVVCGRGGGVAGVAPVHVAGAGGGARVKEGAHAARPPARGAHVQRRRAGAICERGTAIRCHLSSCYLSSYDLSSYSYDLSSLRSQLMLCLISLKDPNYATKC